jgi:glycosyltransferase involved in cell wall biosynthesis
LGFQLIALQVFQSQVFGSVLSLSKLKICYLAGTLGQGGAERQLFYAIQALRHAGATVEVLSLDSGGFWEAPIKQLGVTVTFVGQTRSRFNRICRIVKALKMRPPDILQSQHFYANAYATLSASFLRCRAVGALRSNGRFDLSQCGRLGGRINLHLPKVLAANSQSSLQYALNRGVTRSRLFFLPNAVDTDQFKPAVDRPQVPITLLAVGRLTKEKRFDRFISLLDQLRHRHGLDVRGWIVGPTRSDQDLRPELERQAAALGLRSNALRFLGSIPDMASIYREATIFVLTSEHEGTPNVLLEAMAAGLPVVATSVGGVPEIVQHGRTGFLVAENQLDELPRAILELVGNRHLATEIGARARAFVEVTHSVHKLPAHLAGLYELTLGARRPRPDSDFDRALADDPARSHSTAPI